MKSQGHPSQSVDSTDEGKLSKMDKLSTAEMPSGAEYETDTDLGSIDLAALALV